LKAGQLLRLEHLYRRRVPVDKVITPELARTCTELSAEIRCQIGLVVNRRGGIEQVIVGTGRELILNDLWKYRVGSRSLRGVRLVHTHLLNEPLTQDDLTDLALLRLDLIAAVGIGPDALPASMYVAHILPANAKGQLCEVLPASPFHAFQLDCAQFIDALEDELAREAASHEVKAGHTSAIVVSVSTKGRMVQDERVEELLELVQSDGMTVLDTVRQRPKEIHPKYLLGIGKLKEAVMKALQQGADLLIFDQDLTPAQVRAIAEITDMKVVDRTQVILDIFARRAHSREGKIQVELAQLRYLLPRLSTAGRTSMLSRLGGGIGARGPGETKLETDRRRVRDRITHLEREMTAFARHRDQRRAQRFRRMLPVISIVGYTNVGKSTLLNALTDSHVSAQDRPFETLDTASRRLRFPHDREVIITDTVGFIRDLPKDLIGAFRTTLEELQDADVLLHVADASSRDLDGQIHAVEKTLSDLGLHHIPRLLVLNKSDRLGPKDVDILARRYQAVAISALLSETLPPLIDRLDRFLAQRGGRGEQGIEKQADQSLETLRDAAGSN
jgi:GTP-binding protein HflX